MSRAIKFRNNTYLSVSSITYMRTTLDSILNYNLGETFVGHFNGIALYRKIMLIKLTKNEYQYFKLNLGNVYYRNIYGVFHDDTNKIFFPFNLSRINSSFHIGVFVNDDQLVVETSTNRKGWTGYVILEYVKTVS